MTPRFRTLLADFRRLPFVGLALLVSLAAVGCSESSDPKESAISGTATTDPSTVSASASPGGGADSTELLGFEIPARPSSGYDALVMQATGRTVAENQELHQRAVQAAVEDCLVGRGFQVDEQFPGPGIGAIGPVPEAGQRLASEMQSALASQRRPISDAEGQAWGECQLEIRDTVVDPLTPLWQLVAWYGEDARAQAFSDPAYVKAAAERESCEAQFATPPADAQVEQLVSQFYEARARFAAGELSFDALFAEGRRLRQQEIELEGGSTACEAKFRETVDPIFAHYEALSVEEHAAAFNEAAAKMRDPSQIPPGTLPPLTSDP